MNNAIKENHLSKVFISEKYKALESTPILTGIRREKRDSICHCSLTKVHGVTLGKTAATTLLKAASFTTQYWVGRKGVAGSTARMQNSSLTSLLHVVC